MSYVKFEEQSIRGSFPYSEALAYFTYDPLNKVVSVSYKSNPDHYYDHDGCGIEDLQELLHLVDDLASARYGYDEWKARRKVTFQQRDLVTFNELWDGLNQYQRENLVEYVSNKRKDLGICPTITPSRRTFR